MAAFCLVEHKEGCGGVFFHLRSGQARDSTDRFVGIVHHQLFAEGIDIVLGTSRDYELVRIKGGETDGVADLVAPKTAGCGNHHRIVLADFDGFQRKDGRVVAAHLIDRYKFIEHAVVDHHQQAVFRRIVLQSEESLRSVVGLHVMHPV